MARRHVQVRPREADIVARPARVPEIQKQILDDVLRDLGGTDEPEDVFAESDIKCLERRFPAAGPVGGGGDGGRLPHRHLAHRNSVEVRRGKAVLRTCDTSARSRSPALWLRGLWRRVFSLLLVLK